MEDGETPQHTHPTQNVSLILRQVLALIPWAGSVPSTTLKRRRRPLYCERGGGKSGEESQPTSNRQKEDRLNSSGGGAELTGKYTFVEEAFRVLYVATSFRSSGLLSPRECQKSHSPSHCVRVFFPLRSDGKCTR